MTTPMLSIRGEDAGEPTVECTVEEFLAANSEGLSPQEVELIQALDVDYETWIGGGAAPIFTVRRIA